MRNLKKSVITAVLLAFVGFSMTAQNNSAFGFKGGLNYGANGDYFDSASMNAKHPDRNVGYHVGIFGKIGKKLYFRPELVYTATKSDYNSDVFSIKKIDAPLLVGVKIIGPLSVFGGPSLQYLLDTDFEGTNIDLENVEDEFSVGLNFGVGINFNKVGIDLRYERGLNDNEASFIDNNITTVNSRIDTRPDQLILSLSIGF